MELADHGLVDLRIGKGEPGQVEGSKNYWLMYLGFDFGLLAC
jgi:hypothetical protein